MQKPQKSKNYSVSDVNIIYYIILYFIINKVNDFTNPLNKTTSYLANKSNTDKSQDEREYEKHKAECIFKPKLTVL